MKVREEPVDESVKDNWNFKSRLHQEAIFLNRFGKRLSYIGIYAMVKKLGYKA